jgi:hypothetical protein
MDNMSDDEAVADIYKTLPPELIICRYDGYNDLHDTTKFPDLYRAISGSCRYFSFLDTDEFLSIFADGVLVSDRHIGDFLSRKANPVLPSVWVQNIPGSMTDFYFNRATLDFGLLWGKPIIHSKGHPTGFIHHNVHIAQHWYKEPIDTRFVLLHMSNLYSEQRIRANINKLVQRKIISSDSTVDTVLAIDIKQYSDPSVIGYLDEIHEIACSPFEGRPQRAGLAKGTFRLDASGRILFADKEDADAFASMISPQSSLADDLGGEISNESGLEGMFRKVAVLRCHYSQIDVRTELIRGRGS